MPADDLRLKVSEAEYSTRLGILDQKISNLDSILSEYRQLKNDATLIFGDGDSNLEAMKATVEKNIQAVEGQKQLLVESRAMLEKQNNALGILTTDVTNLLNQAGQTAKTAFNTIKIVGDLVK